MVSEITVVVKDSEKKLTKKFLIYESYQVSHDNPIIKDCIDSTVKDFADQPESIKIRINIEIQ